MTIRLVLLGDSIAAGQGASRPTDTLGARLVTALAVHGVDAVHRVCAVPGSRSSALGAQVDRALRWPPDVAVIVIGANDLSHRTPPEHAAQALRDAVRRLRAARVEVVLAPAPDLSMVPHVPPALRPLIRAASEHLRDRQIAATLGEGGRIADADAATSKAFAADSGLFSADRFHPSSAGYAVIAAALLPEVAAAVRDRSQQSGTRGAALPPDPGLPRT